MEFQDVVPHLKERGFVKRTDYPNIVFFWGMDNCSMRSWVSGEDRRHSYWNISFSDLLSDKWEVIPLHWNGGVDNFLPFDK